MKLQDIASEYRGAVLGDQRRSERLERIGRDLARNPGLSFPEAMRTEGQLEGLYRFLNNDEVTFETVHAPHAERTRSRCLAREQVLVLHDTTVLKFSSDRNKRHMRADPGRESLRWGRAVQACDSQLGLQTRAIHVMDREGDSYDL